MCRLALTAFLPLTHDTPMPSSSDGQALGAYIVEHMDFMGPQRRTKQASLTANQASNQRAVRQMTVSMRRPCVIGP
jgi:hypothetical protein